MLKTAILIDGGHLRATARDAKLEYTVDFIESFAHGCYFRHSDYILRILYYDAPQFRGQVQLPVSGKHTTFQASDKWLSDLAAKERFAVRRGTIAFRGWRPKKIPVAGAELSDSDFRPSFEQKGVDMRVGLDIATLSNGKLVDQIVLVSADTDMVPAMKHARKAGVEVVVAQLPCPPANPLHDTIRAHCDRVREVNWP